MPRQGHGGRAHLGGLGGDLLTSHAHQGLLRVSGRWDGIDSRTRSTRYVLRVRGPRGRLLGLLGLKNCAKFVNLFSTMRTTFEAIST